LYAEELGLSVVIDKNNLNVTVPQMTKEIRESAVKQAKKFADMTKDNIRTIRHDGQKQLKSAKDKVSKDDLYKAEQLLQKVTDEYTKKIDLIFEAKEKEILKM
jgi:ribosome recycling factor